MIEGKVLGFMCRQPKFQIPLLHLLGEGFRVHH